MPMELWNIYGIFMEYLWIINLSLRPSGNKQLLIIVRARELPYLINVNSFRFLVVEAISNIRFSRFEYNKKIKYVYFC